jgi:hypothetical protein
MRRAPSLLIAALLVSGCMESPYAPAPTTADNCGGNEGEACRLPCDLSCADDTVAAAASCMLPLEGTLDAARTRCTFADGSRVTFAWPLPARGVSLTARAWDVKLWSADGALCLATRSQPLPWTGGGFESATEVTTPAGTYRQRLVMGAAGDAGPMSDLGSDAAAVTDSGLAGPRPHKLEVRCASGKHYAAEGADLCASCANKDCRALPLVELVGLWQPVLELRLRSTGGRITPLFTCR